jgi:hypothetical protein
MILYTFEPSKFKQGETKPLCAGRDPTLSPKADVAPPFNKFLLAVVRVSVSPDGFLPLLYTLAFGPCVSLRLAVSLMRLGKWMYWGGEKTLPLWRRAATVIAFLAVATPIGVFAAYWIWPQIGRDYLVHGQWARWVDPPFLVALPCAIAGEGATRWLLHLLSCL